MLIYSCTLYKKIKIQLDNCLYAGLHDKSIIKATIHCAYQSDVYVVLSLAFHHSMKKKTKTTAPAFIYLPQCEKLYESCCFSSSGLLLFASLESFFSFDSGFSGPRMVTSLDFRDLVIQKIKIYHILLLFFFFMCTFLLDYQYIITQTRNGETSTKHCYTTATKECTLR